MTSKQSRPSHPSSTKQLWGSQVPSKFLSLSANSGSWPTVDITISLNYIFIKAVMKQTKTQKPIITRYMFYASTFDDRQHNLLNFPFLANICAAYNIDLVKNVCPCQGIPTRK